MTVPLADSSTVRGRRAAVEGGAELHRSGGPAGVGHLRGDGALPDQVVEGEVLAAQLAGHLGGRAEAVTGGADRLVRLLRVLDLLLVVARGVGHVLGAVHLARLGAGGGQRGLRQRGAVGSHVGDVAVLVEPLGDPHRVAAVEPQLARGLLLQGARRERRARAARVGLLGHVGDGDVGGAQGVGDAGGGGLVERGRLGVGQGAVVGEVAAGGHLRPSTPVSLAVNRFDSASGVKSPSTSQ